MTNYSLFRMLMTSVRKIIPLWNAVIGLLMADESWGSIVLLSVSVGLSMVNVVTRDTVAFCPSCLWTLLVLSALSGQVMTTTWM